MNDRSSPACVDPAQGGRIERTLPLSCLQPLCSGNHLWAKEIPAQCHSEAGVGVACSGTKRVPAPGSVPGPPRKGEGVAGRCLQHPLTPQASLELGSHVPESES